MTVTVDDLVASTAWDMRDREFLGLANAGGDPAMLFRPMQEQVAWAETAATWRLLPAHPRVLRRVPTVHAPPGLDAAGLWLRYVPLNWRHPLHGNADERSQTLAHWGAQLAELYELLLNQVPKARWRWLTNPYVSVDLWQQIRVGFLPVGDADATVVPAVDERTFLTTVIDALVFLGGKTSAPITDIIERYEPGGSKWRQYKNLRDLTHALERIRGGGHPLKKIEESPDGFVVEEALGWLALRDPARARSAFVQAKVEGRTSPLIEWGIDRCRWLMEPVVAVEPTPWSVERPAAWTRDFGADLDWDKRDSIFGPLLIFDEGRKVPAFGVTLATVVEDIGPLCQAWQEMPSHPNILDFLENRAGVVVLRYATIDWSRSHVVAADAAAGLVAQLCSVFEHIMKTVPAERWPLFASPRAWLDIGGQVRLAFLATPTSHPDKLFDEQSFVYLIGRIARAMVPPGPLADGLAPCADEDRRKRPAIENVKKLVAAATRLGQAFFTEPSEWVREGERLDAWLRVEGGYGWFLMKEFSEARDWFRDANRLRTNELTRWGLEACREALGLPRERRFSRFAGAERDLVWSATRPEIEKLESERGFTEAMALYHRLIIKDEERAEVFTAQARCHLALREPGLAIDDASRALEAEPGRSETRVLLVRALIETKKHDDAIRESERLIRDATYNADAHYLRGKALIGLGRLGDARDSFDLALALRPTMLEAMLLRREADRSLVKLGKVVGQQQVTLEIPQSLEPLREMLLAGKSKDVIAALTDPGWADDPDAQLMLARFYGFDAKHALAMPIYDRIGQGTEPHRSVALVGKAGILLDQGYLDAALALFDAVIAEQPRSADAIEGKARTLDRLGRFGEAAAEFRRFVSLASIGTNVRVRVAQLWLDAH